MGLTGLPSDGRLVRATGHPIPLSRTRTPTARLTEHGWGGTRSRTHPLRVPSGPFVVPCFCRSHCNERTGHTPALAIPGSSNDLDAERGDAGEPFEDAVDLIEEIEKELDDADEELEESLAEEEPDKSAEAVDDAIEHLDEAELLLADLEAAIEAAEDEELTDEQEETLDKIEDAHDVSEDGIEDAREALKDGDVHSAIGHPRRRRRRPRRRPHGRGGWRGRRGQLRLRRR